MANYAGLQNILLILFVSSNHRIANNWLDWYGTDILCIPNSKIKKVKLLNYRCRYFDFDLPTCTIWFQLYISSEPFMIDQLNQLFKLNLLKIHLHAELSTRLFPVFKK